MIKTSFLFYINLRGIKMKKKCIALSNSYVNEDYKNCVIKCHRKNLYQLISIWTLFIYLSGKE